MELLGKNMKSLTNAITGSTPARLFFFLMARQKIRPILIPLSGKNLIIFNDFTPKNVTKYYFLFYTVHIHLIMELLGKNKKTRSNTNNSTTRNWLYFFLMARQKIRPMLIPPLRKNLKIYFVIFTPKKCN